MTKTEIAAKYDSFADKYDLVERLSLGFLGLRKIRSRLFGRAKGRVLELAVGTGANFPYYSNVESITAIDLSSGMLKRARNKASKLDLEVSLLRMDSEYLSFPDNYFDTVVDSLTLCTYSDPVAALHEMARVCRSDGRILLVEHGRSSIEWIARLQDRLAPGHARALGCYWNRDPLNLIKQAGLSIISRQRHFLGIFHVIELEPIKTS